MSDKDFEQGDTPWARPPQDGGAVDGDAPTQAVPTWNTPDTTGAPPAPGSGDAPTNTQAPSWGETPSWPSPASAGDSTAPAWGAPSPESTTPSWQQPTGTGSESATSGESAGWGTPSGASDAPSWQQPAADASSSAPTWGSGTPAAPGSTDTTGWQQSTSDTTAGTPAWGADTTGTAGTTDTPSWQQSTPDTTAGTPAWGADTTGTSGTTDTPSWQQSTPDSSSNTPSWGTDGTAGPTGGWQDDATVASSTVGGETTQLPSYGSTSGGFGEQATAEGAPPSGGDATNAYGSNAARFGTDSDGRFGAGSDSYGAAAGTQAPAYGPEQNGYGHQDQAPAYGAGVAAGTAAYGAETEAQTMGGSGGYPAGQAPDAWQQPAGPGGPHQPNGPVATTGGKQPWFKRKGIIIGAIVAIVAIIAAIAIPVGIHFNNVSKGDRLADEFNAAVTAYESVWTSEALDSLEGVVISSALQENDEFYVQSATPMADFAARCEAVGEAKTTLDSLVASPVPELPVEDGADASAKYQEAMTASNALTDKRTAASSLVTDGPAAITSLQNFCNVFPQYNSIANARQAVYETQMLPLLTIPEGGQINFGSVYTTCTASAGCANMADANARAAFADAVAGMTVTFATDMAALAGTTCIMPELQGTCDAMVTGYTNSANASKAWTDSMRTEEPNLTRGELPFPNTSAAGDASTKVDTETDTAIRDAWATDDPNVANDSNPGWQVRSIQTFLGAHEATITDAVGAMR